MGNMECNYFHCICDCWIFCRWFTFQMHVCKISAKSLLILYKICVKRNVNNLNSPVFYTCKKIIFSRFQCSYIVEILFSMIAFIVLNTIAAICPFCILIYSIVLINSYSKYQYDFTNIFLIFNIIILISILDQRNWGPEWELFVISLSQCIATITAAGYTCSIACSRQNSSNPGMVIHYTGKRRSSWSSE